MGLAAGLPALLVPAAAGPEAFDLQDGGDVTGARPWLAGIALAAYLANDVEDGSLRGSAVIELGCGTSPLPSAICALRGAVPCCATDGSRAHVDEASECLGRNALLGDCAGQVQCKTFRWGEAAESAGLRESTWDVVLFADCIYQETATETLANAITQLLRRTPEAQVLAAMGMLRESVADLFPALSRRGLSCRELHPSCIAREAIAAACKTLQGAHEADLAGGLSTEGLAASTRLVEWRWSSLSGETSVDESHRLREEFLDALYRKEISVQAGSGWLPDE